MTKQAEVSTGYKPHKYQREIHEAMGKHRFALLVCHRRFGKTVCAVNALVDAALRFHRNDGRFVYMAPYFSQAKRVSWDYFKQYCHGIPNVKFNEAELTVILPNGCTIRLCGADNADNLRGIYLDGVVMDEMADMKPNVWGEVVRPTLTDRQGWALFIGTPKGINLFYELYQKALIHPDWHVSLFRASETGLLKKEELDAARGDMTENKYAQEFECDFAASNDDILIPVSMAVAAAQRDINKMEVKGNFRVMGVDVARYGNDSSVIVMREGLKVYEPIVFENISNTDLASEVMEHTHKFQPEMVNIDSGRGEGVIDTLRANRYRVNEIAFGGRPSSPMYRNKRAEMWHNMKKFLESGGCIPNDTKLIAELAAQTYNMGADIFTLTSKDMMRKNGMRSPDIADALALTFAVRRSAAAYGGGGLVKADGGGLTSTKRNSKKKNLVRGRW